MSTRAMKKACVLGVCLPMATSLRTPGNITFCNEVDGGPPCVTEDLVWETGCRKIPDSNAKGDVGSSIKLVGDSVCTVFFAEDCDRSDQDDWTKFGSGGYWTIQDGISRIYRSYMCEEAFCSVVTDMGGIDPSLCEKEP
ncbi:hypothetical protein LTR70_010631 [Exophiala xenobiotica]|uniref:Uncharacterized protein n=1 Tax=Lithohypha guttulata TaxID=1690604 RepID=A0ABR0JU83_9EURO|nr:hypothetical protein LTR24_010469 [Lithohypha guttulata]KAK5309070.1 hypothetical protein LTR70_010631 [Exophiala xenobiotica]